MDSNDQGHKTQQSVLTMQYAVFFLRTPHSWFADVNHAVFAVCQKISIYEFENNLKKVKEVHYLD